MNIAAPDKKKAPVKGPFSSAVHVVVVMMVVMEDTGAGDRRCGNGQRENSGENIGE